MAPMVEIHPASGPASARCSFAEGRAAGVRACITDWRTASLPPHRSWTALGFRPTDYRLHRQIDERIAWADGHPR